MKTIAKMIAISFLLGAGIWLMPQKAQAYGGGITFQFFYDDLRPYGNWVNTPEYGYVWVPDVGQGFMPYSTSGYWVYTDYGWTWVSDYPWGWAPFHYGRWYYDNWYGWVWVPGNEWGPGWVTWRQCDGYYGWAPITPGFNVTVNYIVNINIPVNFWVFVPFMHFGRPDMGHYYMNRADNDWLYRRSNFIVNTGTDRNTQVRYYSGPELKEVRRVTGRDIRPVELQASNSPGQTVRGGRMEVYRPEVERTSIKAERNTSPERIAPTRDNGRRSDLTTRNEKSVSERTNQASPSPRQYQDNGKTERQPLPPQRQYQGNERPGPQAQPAPRQNQVNDRSGKQAKPMERKNPAQGKATQEQHKGSMSNPQSKGGTEHPRH